MDHERIKTTELGSHVGEDVHLAGWLHRLRELRERSFLILRDGTGLAQIVVEEPELIALAHGLAQESVLEVEGTVVAQPQAPGGVELWPTRIGVLAPAEPPPFDLFRPVINAQLPTVLDHAAVSLRHPRQRAAWRIAAAAMTGWRAALNGMGFVEIQTPKIVAAATESGANVFQIDYFGQPAYLAQSPQLYKQIMVGVFERVYEVGPVFRAEPHDTPRHLNEYVSLDFEMGFIEDHTAVMTTLTRTLGVMIETIVGDASPALRSLDLTLPVVPEIIPVIDFTEAQTVIARETTRDPRGEPDLAPADERWLGEWAKETFDSDFLFVTGYPLAKRPFYTHPDPAKPGASRSFDLLFRGLELVTGGQRLHRYEDYLTALAERGLSPEPLAGYLEAFKHGMPPHGGCALGLERFVARLLGIDNLREVALFPRDLHRLAP